MILAIIASKLFNLRGVPVPEISGSKGLDTRPDPDLRGIISILGE